MPAPSATPMRRLPRSGRRLRPGTETGSPAARAERLAYADFPGALVTEIDMIAITPILPTMSAMDDITR